MFHVHKRRLQGPIPNGFFAATVCAVKQGIDLSGVFVETMGARMDCEVPQSMFSWYCIYSMVSLDLWIAFASRLNRRHDIDRMQSVLAARSCRVRLSVAPDGCQSRVITNVRSLRSTLTAHAK